MPILDHEVFGPIIGVIPFGSDIEALNIANDSNYALTASVWSKNHKRAKKNGG